MSNMNSINIIRGDMPFWKIVTNMLKTNEFEAKRILVQFFNDEVIKNLPPLSSEDIPSLVVALECLIAALKVSMERFPKDKEVYEKLTNEVNVNTFIIPRKMKEDKENGSEN
ncbi:MAG: hypothetical protein IJ031_05950 [Oscillospiraceae bacterium]|nr:hypothetical protein [Oscillospiraceae bacterium]MBQ8377576.1 hypothetical protein [Oscillospiraceae bacterium]MBQ8884117.1 hypothetical protein [Oscillospiraceae bacterium]